jgi:hypothetical protein
MALAIVVVKATAIVELAPEATWYRSYAIAMLTSSLCSFLFEERGVGPGWL